MNTITVITQLINDARVRFGDVEAVEIPPGLWEPAMDEVTAAGGEVGVDYCLVDGVRVRLGTAGDHALAHIAEDPSPRHLPLAR